MAAIDDHVETPSTIFETCLGCFKKFLRTEAHRCGNVPQGVQNIYDILRMEARPLRVDDLAPSINLPLYLRRYRKIFAFDNGFVSLKEWSQSSSKPVS